jgi:Mob1/phocein family
LWADGVKVKRPIKLPAPQYVNALFDWIEEQVRNGDSPSVRVIQAYVCQQLYSIESELASPMSPHLLCNILHSASAARECHCGKETTSSNYQEQDQN